MITGAASGPELTALFSPGPHPTLHMRDGFGGARGSQQVRTTPGPLCTAPSSCSSITPGSLGPRHEAPTQDSPCGSHRATARPGPERREVAWTQAPHAVRSVAGGTRGSRGSARWPAPPGSHRRPRSGPHRSESGCGGRPEGLQACRRPRSIAVTEAARAPLPGMVPRLLLSWLGGSGEVTQPLSFLIGEMRIKAAPNSPG